MKSSVTSILIEIVKTESQVSVVVKTEMCPDGTVIALEQILTMMKAGAIPMVQVSAN